MIPGKRLSPVPAMTVIAGLAAILLLTPVIQGLRVYTSAYAPNDAGRSMVNSSALASILGEIRTSAADFVWLKTEYYMHRGVRYQPHTKEAEIKPTETLNVNSPSSGNAPEQDEHHDDHDHEENGDHDHDHDHDHETQHRSNAPTLIPAAQKDLRGFIGTIDRAVHPWEQKSVHRLGGAEQILPWYRMVTMINPYHARAYLVGGYLLMKETEIPDHLEQATQFIQEGIRNNPEAFPLHVLLGRVKIQQKEWDEAIRIFRRARDLALKYRSPDGKASNTWSDSDEEDFGFAIRYVPFIQFRILNDREKARKSCREGLRYMPNDSPLKNFLKEIEG